MQGICSIEGSCSSSFHCKCCSCSCKSCYCQCKCKSRSYNTGPRLGPVFGPQAKKTEAANRSPAAAADAAGTESDDVEQRDAGRASSSRGVGTGRGRGRGRVKQKAVRLQPHEVRRPAPHLVATGATGQLEVPLEDPVDRPAKKLKHVSTEGKVVSIATGPCIVFPR